jgi:hypothetical protein
MIITRVDCCSRMSIKVYMVVWYAANWVSIAAHGSRESKVKLIAYAILGGSANEKAIQLQCEGLPYPSNE